MQVYLSIACFFILFLCDFFIEVSLENKYLILILKLVKYMYFLCFVLAELDHRMSRRITPHLRSEASCIRHCGRGYYGDKHARRCEVFWKFYLNVQMCFACINCLYVFCGSPKLRLLKCHCKLSWILFLGNFNIYRYS